MKKLILIFTLALCASPLAAKENGREALQTMWDQANTLYVNGDYGGAIALYDSIANMGYTGPKLFYNLGNAYFKDDRIGKSIVNYHRALRLAPYDKDIEYNLAVANSYIKDRIDPVPEFFLTSWVRHFRSGLSSNAWASLSLVTLALALGCVLVYVLAQKKSVRKAGFFTAIVVVLLCVMSASFASAERRKLLNTTGGIVVAPAASVKSSPDRSSTDLFIIHEGTKVDVITAYNGWTEIMIADGNKGWMLSEAIELID